MLFRLHVSDGSFYDVLHPEGVMLGARTTSVWIPSSPDSPFPDKPIQVDNLHVSRLEPLPEAVGKVVSEANGQ